MFFEHDEIIRISLVNPYEILKGMSPFSPVAYAVEFDAQSDVYNKGIFANNGRLDGMVSTDAVLSLPELQKLKADWLRSYSGSNRDRVAFLMGGLKYQQFAMSSTDMQYLEQQKWTRQKVVGAYGLNRIGVGDYEDINYATIREGRKLLWYDTYIPTDKLILDALNNQWVINTDQGRYQLASDYSKITALQSDMQERAKTGGILVTQMKYPPSLASRIVELPLRAEDIEKWPHLDEEPVNQPASPALMSADKKAGIVSKAASGYGDEYIARVLDPGEKLFKKALDKYFIAQRNALMDNVDKWERQHKSKAVKAGLPVVNAWEFMLSEELEKLELLKIYKPSVYNQAALEKKQVEQELNHGVAWDVNDQQVQYWANSRSVYLEEINTSTFAHARDAIDATIKQGIADGKTVPELAADIKQAVHDVYDVRLGKPVVPNGLFDLGGMSSSMTIARTEMGTIASMARYEIFEEEGIEKIEWVTAGDEYVRDSHRELNGDVVVMGEPFKNGLRYPREQGGAPEDIINCRCAWVAAEQK
jgi:SPP1 gp7 family putative phage head morphogenesis protein